MDAELQEIGKQLGRLADAVWAFYEKAYPRPKPEPPLELVPLGERFLQQKDLIMDIQQFAFRLGDRQDDTVNREVTLTIADEVALPEGFPRVQVRNFPGLTGGTTSEDLTPERDIASEGAFEVPEGATYRIETVAVDNGGNRSVPTVQELTATDEVSPVAEGVLERVPLAERQVEDTES